MLPTASRFFLRRTRAFRIARHGRRGGSERRRLLKGQATLDACIEHVELRKYDRSPVGLGKHAMWEMSS